MSQFDKDFQFLLCVIDIHSKYIWVVLLKIKRITNAFQKFLDESNCKPNKMWTDNGGGFYNRSMKSWLLDNVFSP